MEVAEVEDAFSKREDRLERSRRKGWRKSFASREVIRIEGFVVKGGNHFGHGLLGPGTRDHRRPSLLGRRLELGSKTFPLHAQILVRPWNVDQPGRQVGSVFTDAVFTHGETPARSPRSLSEKCLPA